MPFVASFTGPHSFLSSTLASIATLCTLAAAPHAAAAEAVQELVCGKAVDGWLSDPGQIDSYGFQLASTQDVALAVGDPNGNLGLLRLIVTNERGDTLADTCQGFSNLRLARGDYRVAVRDCLGADRGAYALRLTRQAVNYRPVGIAISPDGARAWITNGVAGTITGLDLVRGEVATEIRDLKNNLGPRALLLSADGASAWVANDSFNSLTHVDLAAERIDEELIVDAHFHPSHLVATADGQRIFVTGEHDEADYLRVLDLGLHDKRTVATGELPGNLVLSPDGQTLYVASEGHGVDVVDVASESVTSIIPIGRAAVDVALTPDGSTALVVDRDSDSVVVIDTDEGRVTDTIAVANRACPTGGGYKPVAIAVSPRGDTAIVANRGCFSVSFLDLTRKPATLRRTLFLAGPLGFGSLPHAVAITPDGTRVYVLNYGSDSVSEIDLASETVLRYLPLTPSPVPCDVPIADNDACADARELLPAPDFIDFVETSRADREASDPIPWCANQDHDRRGRSVWYRYFAERAGILSVDTFGSTYNTILATFTGACGAYTPLPEACSDDRVEPQSRVAFTVIPGSEYFFMVSAFEHAGGILGINAVFQPGPGPVPTPTATPAAMSCGGDCDGDSTVTVDEILLGVNISLGSAALQRCEAADSNRDGDVTVDEVVGAINFALEGCRDRG